MRSIGTKYEKTALNFLKNQGLKFIEKNFLCRGGEIDLIMKDNKSLVFVEVRFRSDKSFEDGLSSVTLQKQKRIIHTATYYLKQHKLYNKVNCRFDVVGISEDKINWIKNAFGVQ